MPPPSSRKRPRSTSNASVSGGQGQGHSNVSVLRPKVEDVNEVLTPHTKRLLKLIQEGTASHAQMAASHLTEMATRASPIVLWDLLGRLQSLLNHTTWACRQHAHWAMQGVAQSLPRSNQDSFLASALPQEDQNLWLTVHDLNMDLVLQRGRILLAAPEQEYDHDDQLLLDGQDTSSSDFVQQRIQLQRYILAKRLGLGAVLQATGKLHDCLPDSITNQDFIVPQKISSDTIPAAQESTSSRTHDCDNEKSIRILLVLEMKRQDSNIIVSHHNPQHLLATELLYRMFDPYWHVRHGALLGITSLLQAWKGKESTAFGAWPQDILARCLCVLALDRFADFASEATTAPVRLAAAQVVALLYNRAPRSVQDACRNILFTLATHPSSWEVRHGGLVAMQFLVVVEKETMDLATTATRALEDDCDDVIAVAAEVLLVIAQTQSTIPSCMTQLWNALSRLDTTFSSCSVPLVRLLAQLLQGQQRLPVKLDEVWNRMLQLLDLPSSGSMIATLQALSRIVPSDTEILSSQPVRQVYAALVLRIFDSFSEQYLHIDCPETMTKLMTARQGAWDKLVMLAPIILDSGKKLSCDILLRMVGLNSQGVRLQESCSFSQRLISCRAAAQLFSCLGLPIETFLHSSILMLLSSPCVSHFEVACLLHRSMFQAPRGLDVGCQLALQSLLYAGSAPCVAVYACNVTQIEQEMSKYSAALASILQQRVWELKEPTTLIQELNDFGKNLVSMTSNESAKSTVTRMQTSALIAGAIVSGGAAHLPQQLTPLIRALMTSLKSEVDNDRIELTCADLVSLLKLLSTERKDETRDKVLVNVCSMIKNKELATAGFAAVRVVESLVGAIPAGESVQVLSPIWRCINRLESSNIAAVETQSLQESLDMLVIVGKAVVPRSNAASHLLTATIRPLILIACVSADTVNRKTAAECVKVLSKSDSTLMLHKAIPLLAGHLQDKSIDSFRVGACKLLHSIIEEVDVDVCPFVRYLLPIVMSLMTDPVPDCAKEASKTFADLVQVAPLVREVASVPWSVDVDDHSQSVMDHLIHGMPLPPCVLPLSIQNEMDNSGVSLRGYQAEGVAWLRFLQTVRLNGALCDSMGLGKTLQTLVAIAMAHNDSKMAGKSPSSLVVCPSSVVGHWVAEIRKFFPNLFTVVALVGNAKQRSKCWIDTKSNSNIVVTSYSVLRGDLARLEKPVWEYCVLDEGHLLKNPKTATALAARKIRSRHRLVLTGTPVQNRVSELWAAFDFLMPNFLGSHAYFSKVYATPIGKGQQPCASPESIKASMDMLKLLHQQVLPFILRREKEQVLKDLPAKCITDIPCVMTDEQSKLYKLFCEGSDVQNSVSALQSLLETNTSTPIKLGSNVLKSLMYLRLLCTHPILVEKQLGGFASSTQLGRSGKLHALNELLRTAGVFPEELTAADNDTSNFYFDSESRPDEDDEFTYTHQEGSTVPSVPTSFGSPVLSSTKCLIFTQFVSSIDVVEKYLFQAHMPSLRYLRLDGRVPLERRAAIVDTFNNDPSIHVLLLTTRVGGLGLNLTGASMVVFLEHDYNPFADLQAMDRAHRIGQLKAVNVYRLVTTGTIEEKIMELQQAKVRMSNAIVNSENSSMYSMGTDRLLDIFTFRSNDNNKKSSGKDALSSLPGFDDLYEQDEEYHSLSVEEFIKGFAQIAPP